MLSNSPANSPQLTFFDITSQLDNAEPILLLARAINWLTIEAAFSHYYSEKGRPAKPIRRMCGLLILKQLYNFSDDQVVSQWKQNPYFQVFCGETEFQSDFPCHSSELSIFRKRVGGKGIEQLFAMSVALHGKAAEENTVLVDTCSRKSCYLSHRQ